MRRNRLPLVVAEDGDQSFREQLVNVGPEDDNSELDAEHIVKRDSVNAVGAIRQAQPGRPALHGSGTCHLDETSI